MHQIFVGDKTVFAHFPPRTMRLRRSFNSVTLADLTRGVLGGNNSKATYVTKARKGVVLIQHAVTTSGSFAAVLCFVLRCVDCESFSSDVLAKIQLVRGRHGVRSLTGVAEYVTLVIRAVNVKITLADTLGDVRTLRFLWLGSLCGVGAMHMTSCGHPCALGTVLPHSPQLQRRSLRADTRTAQCENASRRLHFGSDDIRKP